MGSVAARKIGPIPEDERKRLIRLVHVGKRQLGLDEDNYRTILQAQTGKESCAAMDGHDLNRVLRRFRELGFAPSSKGKGKGKGQSKKLSPKTRHKSYHTQVDKIRALWIECYRVGAVSDRHEGALNKFVSRMLKIDQVDWLNNWTADAAQTNKVIEALKAMKRRAEDKQGVDA